jgi:hypothetical protein
MKVTLEGQGEPKSIKERQGPLLIMDVCLSFDFWLLASEPNIGGFGGFDLTNPRGRFGGERFHLACPKLGLGDAIFSHTILVRSTSVQEVLHSHRYRKRTRAHHCGFPAKGAHHLWREIHCRRLAGPLRILSLGFSLQGLVHQI